MLVLGSMACSDGAGPTATGTIRLILTGLNASATSGGVATATPTSGGALLTINIPAAGDQSAAAPVGTYTVTYTPPANHLLGSGQTFPQQITVTEDQLTTVTVTLLPIGSIQVTVTGLTGSPPNGGTAQAQRTDATDSPIVINVSAAGSGTASGVPVGTYSVTYTPPSGFGVSGTNPVTGIAVGLGATGAVAFTTTATLSTGSIHIVASGLTGASAGGDVSAKLTNNTGATFTVTLPAPTSGSSAGDLTAVPVGSYNVTYTPPSGFQLAAGESNPKVAAVTAGGTTNTTFTAAAIPVGGLLFESDWSAGVGTTDAVLRETVRPKPWDFHVSPGELSVVEGASLGFPSTNCLRVAHSPSQGFAWLESTTAIPLPAIGSSTFYRFYFRNDVSNSEPDASGGNHHPVETAAQGGASAGFVFKFGWLTTGKFTCQLLLVGGPVGGGRYCPRSGGVQAQLDKFTTYRVEFQFTRTAANTWTVRARMYLGNSTTPLFSESQWGIQDVPGTPMTESANNLLLPNSDAHMTKIRFGINGGPATQPDQFHYFGRVMVRSDTWCGP